MKRGEQARERGGYTFRAAPGDLEALLGAAHLCYCLATGDPSRDEPGMADVVAAIERASTAPVSVTPVVLLDIRDRAAYTRYRREEHCALVGVPTIYYTAPDAVAAGDDAGDTPLRSLSFAPTAMASVLISTPHLIGDEGARTRAMLGNFLPWLAGAAPVSLLIVGQQVSQTDRAWANDPAALALLARADRIGLHDDASGDLLRAHWPAGSAPLPPVDVPHDAAHTTLLCHHWLATRALAAREPAYQALVGEHAQTLVQLSDLQLEYGRLLTVCERVQPLLAEKTHSIARLEELAAARDAAIAWQSGCITALEDAIASKEAYIAARDAAIAWQSACITALEDEIALKETYIAALEAVIPPKEEYIAQLEADFVTRQRYITELEGLLPPKNAYIARLESYSSALEAVIEEQRRAINDTVARRHDGPGNDQA
ncbi:MAG: hypothetical protein ACYDAR_06270 [Thermomicrobiales bacterium]